MKNRLLFLANFIFLLLFFNFLLYSQDNPQIKTQQNWQTVLGGNIIAKPQKASWGFVSLTEGKLINAFTGNGTILWQKSLKESSSEYYSITDSDFIYLISQNRTNLYLYNPSGVFLWKVQLNEKAIEKPLPGRDGRIFISGEHSISCYGLNGIRKWQINTEKNDANLRLIELNDGSLLRILNKTVHNNSYGLRISPYGTILEKIEFSGKIIDYCSFYDGLVIVFSNGTIGCLKVANKTAISAWSILQKELKFKKPFKILAGENSFCTISQLTNNTTYLSCNSLNTQELLWKIAVPHLKMDEKSNYSYDNGRYKFYSNNYSISFNENDGKIIWEKDLEIPSDVQFTILSDSGYLICTTSNWTVSGYRLYQDLKPSLQISNNNKNTYSGFSISKSYHYQTLLEVSKALDQGDYNEKELIYIQFLEKQKKIVFENFYKTNTPTNILLQTSFPLVLSKTGTSDNANTIASMIHKATDDSVIQNALFAASTIGYDKEGKMLNEIGNLFSTKKTYSNDKTVIYGINAVYSICRFMGRPAFYTKGKNILMEVITNGSKATKEHTYQIFDKIIKLQM